MNESENTAANGSVRTAETLFEIVEQLAECDGASLSTVADELDYAKSTVHRHLRTVEELGYVEQRDDGYHVGLRFLELGVTARSSHRGYDLVREKVEEIAEETGERAQFFVEEHGKAVYLARSVGDRAVRTDPGIGSRIPL
ncbi:IclR family transcriptional regulator, partial [Halorubrum trueperi]